MFIKKKEETTQNVLNSITKLLFYRLRILNRIKNLGRILSLKIISPYHLFRVSRPNELTILELEAGNFLSRLGIKDHSNYISLWQKADYLFGRGHYWDAQELRKEIFTEMYLKQGIDNPHYCPPLVSSAYTVAIGHLGGLLLNGVARSMGILHPAKQFVLVEPRIANSIALESLADQVIPAKLFNPSSLLVLSTVIENFQIVKSIDGFLDRYELWERVFVRQKSLGERIKVICNDKTNEKLDRAKTQLLDLGVRREAPIAVFHLRNNGNPSESRNVDVQNYVEAAKQLHNLGYEICQIGVNERNALKKYIPYVISFGEDLPREEAVNFFLLTKASLFIGTTSGPATFPTLLGIPSLITNLTSVSRNALSSANTLYVPKLLKRPKGKVFGLEDQFKSRFSFGGEFLKGQFKYAGLQLEENSTEDICSALEELLSRTRFGLIEESFTDRAVRKLQLDLRAPSFGLIANSFIESHSLLN